MITNMETGAAGEYWEIIKGMLPLAALSAALTLALGVHYLRRTYLQRNLRELVGNLLFSAAMASLLVICILCLSDWLLPSPLSPKLELGIAVAVGIFGTKSVDMYLRRRWSIGMVDLLDPTGRYGRPYDLEDLGRDYGYRPTGTISRNSTTMDDDPFAGDPFDKIRNTAGGNGPDGRKTGGTP